MPKIKLSYPDKETIEVCRIPCQYISVDEAKCPCCGEVVIFHPMLKLFEAVRVRLGKPMKINSLYRCKKHQAELKAQGYKAATHSPHNYGCGMDLAIPAGMTISQLKTIFKEEAKKLGLKAPRFGFKAYNNAFLHVDVAFMVKPNPAPDAWQPGVEW